jgi:Xaa-Pro aminopeptidase
LTKRLGLNDVKIVEIPWSEAVITKDLPDVPKQIYLERVRVLRDRMEENGLNHVIVYGDREHFANTRFLTGYDPRFEESLVIVGLEGKPLLLVGLEGLYYASIAHGVEVELYREFSLQGQPRHGRSFQEILATCNISSESKVGVVGTKYMETDDFADAKVISDVPYYLVDALIRTCGIENISDVTPWFTHSSTGMRIPITVDEIARFEMLNQFVYSGMKNAIKALEPGVTEVDISSKLAYDGSVPLSCHIVVAFGDNVGLALNSPTTNELKLGDQLSVCLGVWGANSARTGIAIRDIDDLPQEISDTLEKVYVAYFDVLLRWYSTLRVGITGGEVYNSVADYVEDPFFQVALNAGHLIRDEEWINAPFLPNCDDVLVSGTMVQCDIIVPSTAPYPGAHIEDGLVLADVSLREELKTKYPEVWLRIQNRRERMINSLGYELHGDVLPLSEMQGQVTPFMLSPTKVLSAK